VVAGAAPSGLPGPKGNRETFLWLCETGRAGAAVDLEAAALAVEPLSEGEPSTEMEQSGGVWSSSDAEPEP
jgi:23S rRNA (cytidine1920-2'-O)/16S rRNA (cytidine1409-2'-O)-methyltransferase